MSMIKTILDRIALVVSKYGYKVIIGYYNGAEWNSTKSGEIILYEFYMHLWTEIITLPVI